LLTGVVHPAQYKTETVSGTVLKNYSTPVAYMSQMYRYWRGSLKYKFIVVASKFHKGRLRFVYEPYGQTSHDGGSEDGTGASVITHIFDLSSSNEFEVTIPYQQPSEWCQCIPLNNAYYPVSSSYFHAHDPFITNGQWTMKVQTLLTAPVAAAPVTILVFVSAGDDFEFASPFNQLDYLGAVMSFTPQGEEIQTVINAPQNMTDNSYLIYMGEKLVSANSLIKRMCLNQVVPIITGLPNIITLTRFNICGFPLFPGYDPHGLSLAKGLITTTTDYAFNTALWTPLSWLSLCFVARRGSLNFSLNCDPQGTTSTNPGFLRLIRNPDLSQRQISQTTYTSSSSTYTQHGAMFYLNSVSGISGHSITNVILQPNLSVNLPYFNQAKFSSTEPSTSSYSGTDTWAKLDANWYTGEVTGNSTNALNLAPQLEISWGAGPDFSLGFFLCIPTFYSDTTKPVFTGL
jgi:hypothetical protein